MINLEHEFTSKWRNLDPQDKRKVAGFFYLVEEGDTQAVAIWSMANGADMDPQRVADLIFEYMDFVANQLMNQGHSRANELGDGRISDRVEIDRSNGVSG